MCICCRCLVENLQFGASSLGVFKVKDKEETFKMYKTILETLKPDDDTIWAQGTEVILEEFYDGDEFDVDRKQLNLESYVTFFPQSTF